MKYLLLIHAPEDVELGIEMDDVLAWFGEIERRGARLIGGRLHHSREAASVRVRDGRVLATDGPYAETKDAVGGFDVVECPSRDDILEIAARHPVAPFGGVEIRQLIEDD